MTAVFDIRHGDCLDLLKEVEDSSIDAIITDPPYGLSNAEPKKITDAIQKWAQGERDYVPKGRGFMGAAWDSFVPPPAVWDECLRVLKPGGHLLVFAGTRTQDLMGLSVRLAGFEIRENLGWAYGSGMPKGMNVHKAIESTIKNGKSNTRSLRKTEQDGDGESYTMKGRNNGIMGEERIYERKAFTPETEEAKQWEGWNTSLKPSYEPIIVARKPLEGTVAQNVMKWGTGAYNVDSTRTDVGRWPSTLILNEFQAAAIDEQSGERKSGGKVKGSEPSKTGQNGIYGTWERVENKPHNDTGGASRFFYTAKAKKSERPSYTAEDGSVVTHPTVKPLSLMQWLVRLVTPPGGVVLDTFAGSGATLEASLREGFDCIAMEREEKFLPLLAERVNRVLESE